VLEVGILIALAGFGTGAEIGIVDVGDDGLDED
jgi:hypothetical protein